MKYYFSLQGDNIWIITVASMTQVLKIKFSLTNLVYAMFQDSALYENQDDRNSLITNSLLEVASFRRRGSFNTS